MISLRAFATHGAKLIDDSYFRRGPSLAHHPADILAFGKSFPGVLKVIPWALSFFKRQSVVWLTPVSLASQ